MVVLCENSPDAILVDDDAKRLGDLLCDLWTSIARISLLHANDGINESLRWTLGSRLTLLP